MNNLSSVGPAVQTAWLEILLGFTALTMASAYPDRRCFGRQRIVASWLSLAPLAILAAASGLVGVMYPEALAAAFSQI
jgi:hypothetical protein